MLRLGSYKAFPRPNNGDFLSYIIISFIVQSLSRSLPVKSLRSDCQNTLIDFI